MNITTPNPLLSDRVQLVAFGSEHILSYPTAATLQYAKNVEEFLMPNITYYKLFFYTKQMLNIPFLSELLSLQSITSNN